MKTDFYSLSKNISNQFIQSIAFIDDRAYTTGEDKNAFNASVISKNFAEKGKICAIYSPQDEKEIENYCTVLDKADIVILDWYLNLNHRQEGDEEEDDEVDEDPRGIYTLKLIKSLLLKTRLRLIIIYTGETDLKGITDTIYKHVDKDSFTLGDCSIYSNNTKIIVRGKEYLRDQFKYNPLLNDKVVSYQEMPELIVDEFTSMTSGLLPNYALSAITSIRNHTPEIVNTFSKRLDSSYLGHKVSLEHPSDSKELLTKILGEAITELLEVENIDTDNWIDLWIDKNIKEKDITISGVSFLRTHEFLKRVLKSEKLGIRDKLNEAKESDSFISNKKEKEIRRDISKLFSDEGSDTERTDLEFAILTHHKNLFKPLASAPILTLGSIIKESPKEKMKENGVGQEEDPLSDLYYVCLQQRCDSSRIKENTERRFLFLPLKKQTSDKRNPLIVNDSLILYPDYSSFALRTIKFRGSKGGLIRAQLDAEGFYKFTSCYGEDFEWIVDLKNLQAQRIVNNYCSNLSRVGLDESEWLRLKEK